MESNSGFFDTPGIPDPNANLSPILLYESGSGYCRISRIDRMGRFRVLKSLKPNHMGDEMYETLLRKEFEIGYSLQHSHICEYYSISYVEGLGNCIEMEWVDGRTLEKALSGGTLSREDRSRIADELCDALSYLHSRQVFHRDIKPSNILITNKGNHVKLIDFGLADSDGYSFWKTPAGTLEYVAPEILNGHEADCRSDIYSLGKVLSLLGVNTAIVRKCCRQDPGKRYSNVNDVRKALHKKHLAPLLLVLALGAAAAGLWLKMPDRLLKQNAPVPVIVRDSVEIRDTMHAVAPQQSKKPAMVQGQAPEHAKDPKGVKTAPKQKDSAETLDVEAIDELFRQATGLFEESPKE